MKNFEFQTLEVLSNQELANVKGGYGIPQPIIITDDAASLMAVSSSSPSDFGMATAAANILKH